MTIAKDKSNDENREYWEYIERSSREVEETYPNWKKGGERTLNLSNADNGMNDLNCRVEPANGSEALFSIVSPVKCSKV